MTEILPSPPTSPNGVNCKRVSFGNDDVKTFIYEKESDEPTPILHRQSFTEPDAPVNVVTVTSDTVQPESPNPIPPPTQIVEIDEFRRGGTISPPLPTKKMAEHENPFRPEENLYHEVDPIVEQYLHKPFPPSRPGSAQGTPVKQQANDSNDKSYLKNGLSKEQLLPSEKVSGNQEHITTHDSYRQQSPDAQLSNDYTDDLPPAGKVELVHVKRKRCGCCSVQ
ncbi:unnamed protein product [Auanema sp. JU1783]|nr:unnamed protein product [Auanema sp. JU1783]